MTGKKGVIIGGGTMGTDIAAIFVANGRDVEVVEPARTARKSLSARVLASARDIAETQACGRVEVREAIDHVDWRDACLLIECAPESLELKQSIFARLEAVAPRDLPLTSNSSSFPISQIAEGLWTADRMLGLHFFMPANLVPCVEVIRSEKSDPAVMERVHAIMREFGKRPVRVNKDIPGFLGNRIQAALMREALALLDGGYASAEDIDAVVQYSFGFRYVAAGPLTQKDLSGLDIHYAASSTIFPTLHNGTRPGVTAQRLKDEGKNGTRSGEGFHKWDESKVARTTERYKRALGKALEILRDNEV